MKPILPKITISKRERNNIESIAIMLDFCDNLDMMDVTGTDYQTTKQIVRLITQYNALDGEETYDLLPRINKFINYWEKRLGL